MGYTHYWTPKTVDEKTWKKFLKDAKELHKNLPNKIKIRGGLGTGKPEFSKNAIYLNGDEKRGLNHETFFVSPTSGSWTFCKTARKPYDLLVCALLIAAHETLDYEVNSDGDLEDWLPAIDYYLDVIYEDKYDGFDRDQLEAILPEFLYKELIDKNLA